MTRRCVICTKPLPAGRLMTCGPACAKVAREQEAKRLRDAQAAYRGRRADASEAQGRAAESYAPGCVGEPMLTSEKAGQ